MTNVNLVNEVHHFVEPFCLLRDFAKSYQKVLVKIWILRCHTILIALRWTWTQSLNLLPNPVILEADLLKLFLLEDVPAIEDVARLVHLGVEGLIIEVNELIPFG